jgi:hypothetical protein
LHIHAAGRDGFAVSASVSPFDAINGMSSAATYSAAARISALRAAARSPSVTACFNAPDDAEAIKQNTRRARCRVAGTMAYPSE